MRAARWKLSLRPFVSSAMSDVIVRAAMQKKTIISMPIVVLLSLTAVFLLTSFYLYERWEGRKIQGHGRTGNCQLDHLQQKPLSKSVFRKSLSAGTGDIQHCSRFTCAVIRRSHNDNGVGVRHTVHPIQCVICS